MRPITLLVSLVCGPCLLLVQPSSPARRPPPTQSARVATAGIDHQSSSDVMLLQARNARAIGNAPVAGSSDTATMARIAGLYTLQGVPEVGSQLLLRRDGTFEFMLAYGALDESGAGSWRVKNGAVVLQSAGVPRAPAVRLAAVTGIATDSLHILVVDTAGRPLSGMTIDATGKQSGRTTAQSTQDGHTLRFRRGMPPTELGIGVDMVDFRVAFPLGGKVGAAYRFVFDRGDLGTRRFERERLEVGPDRLIMTINGRPLTYVRR